MINPASVPGDGEGAKVAVQQVNSGDVMTQLLSQIEDAVRPQRDAYIERNPASARAFASAKAAGIAGGTNRFHFLLAVPMTFIDGEGARVKTADGQTLTDFLGNFTAGLLGIRRSRLFKR